MWIWGKVGGDTSEAPQLKGSEHAYFLGFFHDIVKINTYLENVTCMSFRKYPVLSLKNSWPAAQYLRCTKDLFLLHTYT